MKNMRFKKYLIENYIEQFNKKVKTNNNFQLFDEYTQHMLFKFIHAIIFYCQYFFYKL